MEQNNEGREADQEALILDSLRKILEEKRRSNGPFLTQDKVTDFIRTLKKEGVDAKTLNSCKIYHVLIGSTDGTETRLDLGDGRLAKFIREEL